jgi:outer membrane lipoprotein-sorting protein
MKATFIKSILAAFIIILSVSVRSKAQTYYPVYLCDGGTATLHTPEESTLSNGDKVHWYLEGTEVAVKTFTGTANETNYVTPGNLANGVHNYTSKIESVAGCLGDLSDPFQVYQLPSKTLALVANNASYCGSDATLSSVITATTTPGQALPAGIEYAYVWSATKNGTNVNPLSGIGSDDASKTDVNKFTLNTTGAGTYVFSATVKYVKTAANTGALKSGDNKGCEVTATATQTVTVTPKPVKPTIIIQ